LRPLLPSFKFSVLLSIAYRCAVIVKLVLALGICLYSVIVDLPKEFPNERDEDHFGTERYFLPASGSVDLG
jgi:hypothetical protein